jgi:DNA-binding NarL/FixJ family response regulator
LSSHPQTLLELLFSKRGGILHLIARGVLKTRQPALFPAYPSALDRALKRIGHLTLVAVVRQSFDLRAIPALFETLPDFRLVECTDLLDLGSASCQALRPDVLLVDTSFADGTAFTFGERISTLGCVRVIAFIDHRFAFWRAFRALSTSPQACYLTRDLNPLLLSTAFRGLGTELDQSFIGSLADLHRFDRFRLFSLSNREMDVLQFLAAGRTVRQVSDQLRLAESTVDNHKNRIMKKLGVHRSQDLIRIAVATGMADAP